MILKLLLINCTKELEKEKCQNAFILESYQQKPQRLKTGYKCDHLSAEIYKQNPNFFWKEIRQTLNPRTFSDSATDVQVQGRIKPT